MAKAGFESGNVVMSGDARSAYARFLSPQDRRTLDAVLAARIRAEQDERGRRIRGQNGLPPIDVTELLALRNALRVADTGHETRQPTPEWVTVDTAHSRTGVPARTLRTWGKRWVESDGGAPVRAELVGKTWRLNLEAVQQQAAKRRTRT